MCIPIVAGAGLLHVAPIDILGRGQAHGVGGLDVGLQHGLGLRQGVTLENNQFLKPCWSFPKKSCTGFYSV